MKEQKDKFIKGCGNNGLTKKKAEEIFDLIEPFVGYGFNKPMHLMACLPTELLI